MPLTYPYNINPAARGGQGRYGAVPGIIGMPNPAADLASRYPNLNQTNAQLSSDIMAGLQGQLSPGTVNMLQDANAAFGVSSGMPNSGFVNNRFGRNLGLASEDIKNRAIGQYASIIPTISGTQTVSPNLQNEIAVQNALNSAAPDPSQAGSYAEQLYQRYLQSLATPAGGTRIMSGGSASGTRPWYESGGSQPGQVVANSLSSDVLSGGVPMTSGTSRADWLSSIGYTGSMGPGGGGGNSYFYAGPNTGDLSQPNLETAFWEGGGGGGGEVYDWMNDEWF